MAFILAAGSEGLDVGLLPSCWADEAILRRRPHCTQDVGKGERLLTQEQGGLTAVGFRGVVNTPDARSLTLDGLLL